MMRALLAVPVALALAACTVTPPEGAQRRLTPRLDEAVTSYAFAGCTATLASGENARLRGFVRSLPLSSSDTIIVSVPPAGTPAADAQRVGAVRHLFSGAPAEVRLVTDDEGAGPCRSRGVIRLVHVKGLEIDCRDGIDAPGCASARNLAAMMADPSDTFLPRKGNRSLPPTGRVIRFEDSEIVYDTLPQPVQP